MESVNPATGALVARYEAMSNASVDTIVAQVHAAQRDWMRTSFRQRAEVLREVAARLRAEAESLAGLMADEMGKVLVEGRAEVEKCAWVCEYYAEHAAAFLAPEPVTTEFQRSFVAFRPLGVVLAVMPWNFPLWQVFRFAAPALMAGNGGLLKHASNVSGCALAIERLLGESGLPDHGFRALLIPASSVGRVIDLPTVAAVTLTGSTPAGRAVAARAGAALKKTVLELGGSDPYVVLEDADVEAAARASAVSRLINAGQSCIAAKRFVVVEAVREAFEEALCTFMAEAVMGDPRDTASTLGPQARHDLRDELHQQVLRSRAAGARVLLGGDVPDRDGAFYPPTVLTDVGPGMPAYEEELFGPVAAILPAGDEAAALRIANDSAFGLGAAVFTRDAARGERIATEDLEAGCCFVNDFVRSDPRLPFGGVKQSGYGRELGAFGLREFVNVKSVVVR